MRSRCGAATLALLVSIVMPASSLTASPRSPSPTPEARRDPADPRAILRALHSDFESYIHAIRILTETQASVSPDALYSGLVRIGGVDPGLRADAPAGGRGMRNDVVLFASALDPARAPAWRRLILDHEYFHARHLAEGWRTPLVDFGDARVNHDFYEAVAWGYVLQRGQDGVYGDLPAADMREVRALYQRHFQAIRAFILERQPSAWAHYGRFMPDLDDDGARRQAPGERDEVVRSTSHTAPGGAVVTGGGPR